MTEFIVNNLQETANFARAVAITAKKGAVFALKGSLGAGKTAFSKEFINSLSEKPVDVTSPTFNLLQTYPTNHGFEVWHYDLYRLKNASEAAELSMDEAFDNHVSLIEWPEIIENILPKNTIVIEIEVLENYKRRLTVTNL